MSTRTRTTLAAALALALAGTAAVAQDTTPNVYPTQAMPSASNPMSSNPNQQSVTLPTKQSGIPDQTAPLEVNRANPPPANPLSSPQFTRFEQLDSDRDGLVARSEADAELALSFGQWDADGDGKLSRAEYARFRTDKTDYARLKTGPKPPDKF